MSGAPLHEQSNSALKRTALYNEHVALGAKIVPFAGYEMPVQYLPGVLKEHLWTREQAGLFDVSHMGQAELIAGDERFETAAAALEALVPADILNIKPLQQRYTQLLNASGGIIDDLMVFRNEQTRPGQAPLSLIVNAGRKNVDYAHIASKLPKGVHLKQRPELSLLALQGPMAHAVLQSLCSTLGSLGFMTGGSGQIGGISCSFTRSGYTGEDGYEISVKSADAAALWQRLLKDPRVQAIGLGARDSLRLEAGLCLYGHDIDEATSPVEAGLTWSIQKRRRTEGGFPGAARIQRELADGPARLRVGIKPDGRAPAREGTEILTADGKKAGTITSGGFGPTVNGPVAMGYIDKASSAAGTAVQLMVRGKPLAATVANMPFAPHRYARKV